MLEGRESSPDRDLDRGRLLDADSKAKEEAGAFQVDAAAAYTAKLKMMQSEVEDIDNGQIGPICNLF